jgi:hypothetical protein
VLQVNTNANFIIVGFIRPELDWIHGNIYGTVNNNHHSKFIDRGKIETPNAQMHDRSLSLLDIGTSLKRGGVKLDL